MRFKKPDEDRFIGKINLATFASGKSLKVGSMAALALTTSLALTGCERDKDGGFLTRADGTVVLETDRDPEAEEARRRDREERQAEADRREAEAEDRRRGLSSNEPEDNDGGRVC